MWYTPCLLWCERAVPAYVADIPNPSKKVVYVFRIWYVAYVIRHKGSVKAISGIFAGLVCEGAFLYGRIYKELCVKSTANDILNIFIYSHSPYYYAHFGILNMLIE